MVTNHALSRTNYPVDPYNIMLFLSNHNENVLHASQEHSLKFDPLDLVQYNPAAL